MCFSQLIPLEYNSRLNLDQHVRLIQTNVKSSYKKNIYLRCVFLLFIFMVSVSRMSVMIIDAMVSYAVNCIKYINENIGFDTSEIVAHTKKT